MGGAQWGGGQKYSGGSDSKRRVAGHALSSSRVQPPAAAPERGQHAAGARQVHGDQDSGTDANKCQPPLHRLLLLWRGCRHRRWRACCDGGGLGVYQWQAAC